MVNLNQHSNFHYMNELRSPNESSSMFFSKITSKFGLGCKRLNNLNDLNQMNNDYNTSFAFTYDTHYPQPNIALISIILLFSTCAIALLLKKLRRSNFFGSIIRRSLSDVGIILSIICMVLVDYLIREKTHINTQKLIIPDQLVPTHPIRKSWIVSPFGNNFDLNESFPEWIPFAAIFPAFLVFIVLFFEVELTGYQSLFSSIHD